jgi:hypothetical protein
MNKRINTFLCVALSVLVVPAYAVTKDAKYYENFYTDFHEKMRAEIENVTATNKLAREKEPKDRGPEYDKQLLLFNKIAFLSKKRNAAHARWVRHFTNKETLTDRLVDLSDDAKQIIVKHDKISKGIGITAALTAAAGISYFAHKQYKKSKNKLNKTNNK